MKKAITEKRWIEHPGVYYTIFSKYLALPIAIFPMYNYICNGIT